MNEWLNKEEEETLNIIAAQIAKRYRKYGVEREDLAQDLRMWAWRNIDKIVKWRDIDGGSARLSKALEQEGTKAGEIYKAQSVGYEPQDLFYYDTGMLEGLLRLVFRQDWTGSDADMGNDVNQDRARVPAGEGGNRTAMLSDVYAKVMELDRDDRGLLYRYYGLDETQEALARLLHLDQSNVSRRIERAVQRLQRKLGGQRPDFEGPGSRRAVTNAQARALTEQLG